MSGTDVRYAATGFGRVNINNVLRMGYAATRSRPGPVSSSYNAAGYAPTRVICNACTDSLWCYAPLPSTDSVWCYASGAVHVHGQQHVILELVPGVESDEVWGVSPYRKQYCHAVCRLTRASTDRKCTVFPRLVLTCGEITTRGFPVDYGTECSAWHAMPVCYLPVRCAVLIYRTELCDCGTGLAYDATPGLILTYMVLSDEQY
eukprot:2623796-Rhodomonas_salina.2